MHAQMAQYLEDEGEEFIDWVAFRTLSNFPRLLGFLNIHDAGFFRIELEEICDDPEIARKLFIFEISFYVFLIYVFQIFS